MDTSQHHQSTAENKPVKTILLCADDFGMNRQINAGILALAQQGRLSATSCMSRGEAFRQDAAALARLPIEKGLHLNLTEALDGKEFCMPLSRLLRHCYTGTISRQVISAEIEFQLNAFEAALGSAPAYVDGHQHVHQFPIVRECLTEILLRRYHNRLPWLRSTCRPAMAGIPLKLRLKAAIIDALGARALRHLASRNGFRMNAHLLGAYDFTGGEAHYRQLLSAWLAEAGTNDLLMCHPASDINAADPIGPQRCAEFAVLSGPHLPALLAQHQASIKHPG